MAHNWTMSRPLLVMSHSEGVLKRMRVREGSIEYIRVRVMEGVCGGD